jgi:hypothetical protein
METTRFRLTIKQPMPAPPAVPGELDILHGIHVLVRADGITVAAATDDPRDLARHLTSLAYALLETPHTLAAVSGDRRAIQALPARRPGCTRARAREQAPGCLRDPEFAARTD